MQSLILGALGLEDNKSGNQVATVIARVIKSKGLQRQLPELIKGMSRDPGLPEGQRRELLELMKGKLPKELVNLTATKFQERLGQAGVSAPTASCIYLVLELELLNQMEDQGTLVQPVAAKAVKKKWPGAAELDVLANDWKDGVVQRRYDLAHRLQLIQGQSPKLKVSQSSDPGSTISQPPSTEPRLEPISSSQPDPSTMASEISEGTGPPEPGGHFTSTEPHRPELDELTELTPRDPDPIHPVEPTGSTGSKRTFGSVQPSSSKTSGEPGADGSLKSYPGDRYKLFIGGKGIPILEFVEQRPGEALVTTKEPHPLLEEWLARGDPAVLYIIEKSGSETNSLQGCKVMEGQTVYKLAYRTSS